MEVLFFLIPLAVALVGLVIVALVWAVRSGQFEDLEGPAHRILMDRDEGRERPPERQESAPGPPRAGEPGSDERKTVS